MRQAINNLQSTYSGFRLVSEENVFKVCDQPHPKHMQSLVQHCLKGEVDQALDGLRNVFNLGYSVLDIITTLFKVVKNFDAMPEYIKLEYAKVSFPPGRGMGEGKGGRAGTWIHRVRFYLLSRKSD